jgi:iodotyrosine deiodinase
MSMTPARFTPVQSSNNYSPEEMQARAVSFRKALQTRRTIRDFSDQPVPKKVLQECLLAAGSAPSGANLQPWHFVVVSDPKIKEQIRVAAEEEEHEFYTRRAPREWLDALELLGTDESKPFLETAPFLIVIFALTHSELPDGRRAKNYYISESVGIATGMLITALHHAGLATLTHTPSPMGFLNTILDRPASERPYLVLVTGHPAKDAQVPIISKKMLEEFATFI